MMKRWFVLIALGVMGLAAWAGPALGADPAPAIDLGGPIRSEGKPVSLDVTNADAKQVLDKLSAQIGSPVVMTAATDQKLTLKFAALPLSKALSTVATELGCKWQRRYTLFKMPENTKPAAHQPSGRVISAEVSDQNLPMVAKMVAKGAGGIVVIEKGLEGKATLKAENMPVEKAFDSICAPLGADWKVEFLLTKSVDAKPAEAAKEPTTEKKEPTTRVASKATKVARTPVNAEPPPPDQSGTPQGPRAFPNTSAVTSVFGVGTSADKADAKITESFDKMLAMSDAERQSKLNLLNGKLTDLATYMAGADPETYKRFMQNMGASFRSGLDYIKRLTPEKRKQLPGMAEALQRILDAQKPKTN